MAVRRRLDAELVRRGLVTSRTEAQEAIAAYRVLVNGAVAEKPARLVATGDAVTVAGPPSRFVGRGGEKLDGALHHFGIDVDGHRVLDVGASTGGFTDALLGRGAREVVALDVGHGQLHPRLRDDPRVTVLERTNIRSATTAAIGGPVDAIVADLSFISLTKVIPTLVTLCHPGSPMVLLVKPQFEAGRGGGRARPRRDHRPADPRPRAPGDRRHARGVGVSSGGVGRVADPRQRGQSRVPRACSHRRGREGARMTTVAIVAHHGRTEAATLAREAVEWLAARGHEGWVVPDDAAALDLGDLVGERALATVDLVVSLGGDGTMLRAVRLLDGATVPLLGVNLGLLGYLTEIEPPALTEALERFVAGREAGRWHLDERMLLDVATSGAAAGTWRALNEVVVEKHESGHTVHLLVRIAGEPFTSYAADGLIVATPTGSTAYSLSARGPVVSPRHRALLLTPVSPHMLFDRTLVLDPSETVELEVGGDQRAGLAVDGRLVTTLNMGEVVTCRASDRTASFVRFAPYHFHQILKAKFGLADR